MRHQRRGARLSPARRAEPRQHAEPINAAIESAPWNPNPGTRPMTVLFWDIDGTLLTTGKAGVPAWEAAVREVTGRDFQLSSIRVPGLTDYQIAVRTFEMLGVSTTDDLLKRMVTR